MKINAEDLAIRVRSNAMDYIDQKFQKVLRVIKKNRWQGHYSTRKKSKKF